MGETMSGRQTETLSLFTARKEPAKTSSLPDVVNKPQGESLQADLLMKLYCLTLPMYRPDSRDNCIITDQIGEVSGQL